ncbi:enoyl-CoA hydratase/isomerase family protein [Papillibacter cinnamivorans]|uniref:short-chain-enoyl-CoA hydratase n=1 Tax=Papillibacter cinnamivorans DSM 12816 TaxID=1122930 RepID=A0A1W2CBW6_9FIRM|nr:enoyl-CoA hydratase-related protein [Papillibacter cinnamivorans]SMC82670.1 enoyl-CoA hydratase [Papillibacter cinnamivorans DSM 12816]
MEQFVKYEIRENGICVVSVNRPEVFNALNMEVYGQLEGTFDRLGEDPGVRVIILRGEGEKAFAAGTDINMMMGCTPEEFLERTWTVKRVLDKIESFSQPVIAAVNGMALGGGCELAMACDIRIAADSGKFGQPEINLGLIPGGGGTQRLPRLVGISRAKQLVYTGDVIGAQRALEIGLVDQVVPLKDLMAEAEALALKIAAKSKVIMALAKNALNSGFKEDLVEGLESEVRCFNACFSTYDRAEGMQAFVQRRKPRFEDR